MADDFMMALKNDVWDLIRLGISSADIDSWKSPRIKGNGLNAELVFHDSNWTRKV